VAPGNHEFASPDGVAQYTQVCCLAPRPRPGAPAARRGRR